MDATILQTESLTKRYGTRTTVDGVSLGVRRGEICGFLGPNGAGKTTVMRMILGLVAPSSGSVTLFGEPAGGRRMELRSRIGAVSEKPYLYADMTALEYLAFFAGLYGVAHPRERSLALLERLALLEAAGKRLKTFSQGMQQRVNIARAFLHDPELLLLDEPVSGLDPHGIRIVRDLIQEARARGRGILISSHLLSIVEDVCDRVAIMNAGRLLAEETIQGIREKLGGQTTIQVEVAEPSERILQAVSSLPFVREAVMRSRLILLKAGPERDIREKISRRIVEAGGTVLMVGLKEPSLEETFLELTDRNVSLLAAGS
jgi:ABC-2 type transport system ATP-binding protein